MPNDAQTADEIAGSTAEHVADTGATVVQLSPQVGAPHPPATEADDRPTVCPLNVGELDERGNTVEYIYARDPHYIVYFSRLEQPHAANDNGGLQRAIPQRGRWWPLRRRAGRAEAETADTWKGVQAQLSNDPARRRAQRRNLLGLGVERAKLQTLLSDWPRRQGYDASIATALQMALDGDGDRERYLGQAGARDADQCARVLRASGKSTCAPSMSVPHCVWGWSASRSCWQCIWSSS